MMSSCSPIYHSTGKKRDAESGLDYFGARYYSSVVGRFSNPDDGSDQDPSSPQSWNLYSYVQNNPLLNVDPDGHTCQTNSSDGNVYDNGDGGGSIIADQNTANYIKSGHYDTTVSAKPGNAIGSLLLNGFSALSNTANDYFATITGLRATPNSDVGNDYTGKVASVAAGAGLLFIGPEGEGGEAINITEKGLKHVMDRHVVGGIASQGKSLFDSGVDIASLVRGAEATIPEQLPNGDLRFTVDAGRSIEVDRSTGSVTSKYTVVTDSNRNLLTTRPGAYN